MIKQIQTVDDAIEHYRTVSDLYRKEISGDENAGGIEHIVAATRALATEILELRKLKDKPSPTSIVESIFKELGLVWECPIAKLHKQAAELYFQIPEQFRNPYYNQAPLLTRDETELKQMIPTVRFYEREIANLQEFLKNPQYKYPETIDGRNWVCPLDTLRLEIAELVIKKGLSAANMSRTYVTKNASDMTTRIPTYRHLCDIKMELGIWDGKTLLPSFVSTFLNCDGSETYQ